ncbi:MAG TPA: aromatic ring-hydroxylating dioxygenase subunit alpha, partial [Alphaproteobacteria bacterium]|nr:aromatic ring-hydroxylating dioxygenase subunit alpha [Alphaproteobacteria bacterium]
TQIQEHIAKMRRYAFLEQDAPMIEAQQRVLDSARIPLIPVILPVDVGPVRYKRILRKMIEQERLQSRG